MNHLYLYSDAPEWGGQEILSANIANILARMPDCQVHFFFSTDKFREVLDSAVEQIRLPYCSQSPFPIIRDVLSFKARRAHSLFEAQRVKTGCFDRLIVCPGNIERCVPAILAARRLGIEITSYYPMAFTQKESHARFGAFRDALALRIYPKVSRWVVNTPYQERLLRRFVTPETPVFQLPNPLTFAEIHAPKPPRRLACMTNIGRLFFGQKGQQIIPEILRQLDGVEMHVIGNGPDENPFRKMVRAQGLQDRIHMIPWLDPAKIHEHLAHETDALLVTSKYESGPMVLFEALQCGIPVMVAREDYVLDYHLPDWMLYEPGNATEAAEKIRNLPNAWDADAFGETRRRLFRQRSATEFAELVRTVFLRNQ